MIQGRRAPRGVCPVCLRSVSGRLVDGKLILRSHTVARGRPCSGSHKTVPEAEPGA